MTLQRILILQGIRFRLTTLYQLHIPSSPISIPSTQHCLQIDCCMAPVQYWRSTRQPLCVQILSSQYRVCERILHRNCICICFTQGSMQNLCCDPTQISILIQYLHYFGAMLLLHRFYIDPVQETVADSIQIVLRIQDRHGICTRRRSSIVSTIVYVEVFYGLDGVRIKCI